MFKSTTEIGVRERVKCGINGGGNISELETPREVTTSRTDKSAVSKLQKVEMGGATGNDTKIVVGKKVRLLIMI